MGFGDVFVEQLRCEMTAEERIRKSEELADGLKKLSELEAEKARKARELKEQVDTQNRLNHLLAYDVRTGTEERPVECYEHARFEDLQVDVYRKDTKTVFRTRGLQPHERQMWLDQLEKQDAAEPSDEESEDETVPLPEPDDEQDEHATH